MRQLVIPTLQTTAATHFPKLPQSEAYEQLKRDLNWDEQEWGTCYLVGMDRDRRHSWTDFRSYRSERAATGRGKKRDRRLVEYGQGDHIQFQERQLIPSAARVPDTIQQPVESCIGWIKRRVRCMTRGDRTLTYEKMRASIVTACEELNNSGNIKKFWDHSCKAIAVFAAEKNQKVKVNVRGKDQTFRGTQGGWVSKKLSG